MIAKFSVAERAVHQLDDFMKIAFEVNAFCLRCCFSFAIENQPDDWIVQDAWASGVHKESVARDRDTSSPHSPFRSAAEYGTLARVNSP